MTKPIIGIVTSKGPDPVSPDDRDVYFVGQPYVDRVLEAGGAPVLIPHGVEAADIVDLVDGWLIIGGRDLDPALYGQTPHQEATCEPRGRFELESDLFSRVPDSLPVLGICYGCQFLNVVRGGDLIQHLPDVVGHGTHTGGTSQQYKVEAGSKVSAVVGSGPVSGKSYHHQAVLHVGQGLKATAWAEDGTIEAIEDTGGRWIMGVQWHPERTPEDPVSQALFREFVAKAAKFKEEKTSCGTW